VSRRRFVPRKPAITLLGLLVLLGLCLALLPLAAGGYVVTLAFFFCVFVALAESYNIVGGYLGYMNLGHTSFFGMSAYTFGILGSVANFHL
jgi:branched-chain amino acid transport system permease protein